MEVAIDVAVSPTKTTRNFVTAFAPTIFLSAFLLFCCEPMVGKMMLPLLGGAASVWITCLLFFQLMLLTGYGYAHALERYLNVRAQIFVHATFMLMAIFFLPIHFNGQPDTTASAHPTLWLLGALVKGVAIPFCIVATTAPLLQNWLSKTPTASGRDPYFLYAVSNAGSLLALLAYPLLIEPRWGVRLQTVYWLVGYAALFLFLVVAAALVLTHSGEISLNRRTKFNANPASAPNWGLRAYWLAAAFVPSGLMLAVTNHMLLNLASVPFLWVLPLAIYLITFMIAFARRLRISARVLSAIVPIVLLILLPVVAVSKPIGSRSLWYVLGSHMLVLLAGALLCHTALASRRPETSQLTEYYFWIALGGALGGIFVAVIAPSVFSSVIEYPLLLAMIAFFRDTGERGRKIHWSDWIFAAIVGSLIAVIWYAFKWRDIDVTQNLRISVSANAFLVLIASLAIKRRTRFALALAVLIGGYRLALPGFLDDSQVLHMSRNFFGIKKVVYEFNGNMRKLLHGDTLHGLESRDSRLIGQPLSYYHPTGPVGDIMKVISDRPNQHIGVVGLGTGSMAGWARPDRHVTFFDIDPQVYDISYNFFTYLQRCAGNCDVVIGDGRLSIEKARDSDFDLLMLDAFNSDSVPAHLVSREAVQIYLKKLKPNGMILFNVSNRYMNIASLVSAVLIDAGLQGLVRYDSNEAFVGKTSSDYVVAARQAEAFGKLVNDQNWTKIEAPKIQPWTDDYSNMLTILRWRRSAAGNAGNRK